MYIVTPINLMYYELMKKKLLISIVLVGIVIISVVAVLLLANRDTSYKATTLAAIRKTLKDDSPECLRSTALAQEIPVKDRTGIENAVVTSIIDIPAGTNVDVRIATFSDTEVTGSAIYPDAYGSYNYVVKKASTSDASSSDYFAGWKVTSFVACKT